MTTMRLMQWNILADGLSDDGFLLSEGIAPEELKATLAAIKEAKAHNTLHALKAAFETPEAKEKHASLVSWERRWSQMQAIIKEQEPDVITFQELDHMADVQGALETIGYACAMPGKMYSPLHSEDFGLGKPEKYLQLLRESGVAFAPKLPSTCRNIGLKTRPEADDDGCAVFWRLATIDIEAVDFLPIKNGSEKYEAAVRVALRRKIDGLHFFVLCTHLGSGDKDTDEFARLRELESSCCEGPSLHKWIQQSMQEGPTLICLDANSSPGRSEEKTVWKQLRGIPGVGSVWDEYFTVDGATRDPSQPLPVTTNKMRGPLSDQPKKIGEHMCHVIDHVFFSCATFMLSHHVWQPMKFPDKASAENHLLPSTTVPSDHAPVIVDLHVVSGPAKRSVDAAANWPCKRSRADQGGADIYNTP